MSCSRQKETKQAGGEEKWKDVSKKKKNSEVQTFRRPTAPQLGRTQEDPPDLQAKRFTKEPSPTEAKAPPKILSPSILPANPFLEIPPDTSEKED